MTISKSLPGVGILVTRPEPENALTCEYLKSIGARPISLPTLYIEEIKNETSIRSIQSRLFDLDLYKYVIFVSKNAARLGAERIDECWPMLPAKLHWIGIGKGTTQTLIDLGFPALANPGLTSEALLNSFKPIKLTGDRILIVRGEGGRPTLADGLEKKGAKVDLLELYKRIKPSYTAQDFLFMDEPDLIWSTSVDSLLNLTHDIMQYQTHWLDKPIFVPSQRVAETALSLGWKNICNASGADDDRLTEATMQYLGRKDDR
ncbi:uroporphyrinogen-III synthase [Marinomonas balearica]|uniref:Uroporphyrinogen-III synthase n=1 Tax=Marinomonas balearica TaxID=491947 RepID=A0A4R6M6M2_9GAMM|nr:uroporphyrinogen-III synthase [Marinomonas balearica]TDO96485.1 uroporphyrinogen-III synthase [Marinomonas balearica]